MGLLAPSASGQVTALQIEGLRPHYSAPYLLDFNFTLRDQAGHSIITNVSQIQFTCMEDGAAISPSEAGARLLSGDNKQLKSFLVLDYTRSMLDPELNGDSDGDGRSDSVEAMEAGAKALIGALHADAQLGLYEFHRAEAGYPPTKVAELANVSVGAGELSNRVDQLFEQVVWSSGSTRCWDALYLAAGEFPAGNPGDDQRFVVFLSDGKDESSTRTVDEVISLAQERQVKLYCIGYGAELTPANLQRLTGETGGRYYAAGSVAALTEQFQQIVRDLGGQYVLRWVTLKRGGTSFTPSFTIKHAGQETTATGPTYTPGSYTGDELVGRLRFDSAPVGTNRTAALTLRAAYIPRGITRIRLSFMTAHPFQVQRAPFDEGGICPTNWTFQATTAAGITTVEFASPNPANPFSALPFATEGKLLRLQLQGVTNLADCFYEVALDNSSYQGGYSLSLENAADFMPSAGTTPHGTPVEWLQGLGYTGGYAMAELADLDSDGQPNWMEYLAGTNPTNRASAFRLLGASRSGNGWAVQFSSESNRIYRVDWSADLKTWQTLQEGVRGNGLAQMVADGSGADQRFYRAVMTEWKSPYVPFTNGVGGAMVWLKPGKFTLGSPAGEAGRDSDEGPQTEVTLTKGFWMGKYEVTQAEYEAVMGSNPSNWKGATYPVEQVSWTEATEFCRKLTLRERNAGMLPAGYEYRLPTEAQWEYACRAGTTTRFSFGDSDSQLGDYAWYDGNGGGKTHPVGEKQPNAWGLHDLHGNVWEWCSDWYGNYPGGSVTDPTGATSGSNRVYRGGSWRNDARDCRSANRDWNEPWIRDNLLGFRAVLVQVP